MDLKNLKFLTQSLLIAATLSVGLTVSACSAKPSTVTESVKHNDPKQTYELGLAYYEGDSVPEDDDKAFEWYKKAADQDNQEASNRIGRLVMDNKIDDEGIIIYSTEDTGLTLGDIEEGLRE